MLFLKVFSWETDVWVKLGDFTVKKRKIGKGNLYLTENRLSWNEICCAADNHNYMSHMCKRIVRFELQFSSYWQNIKFSRNCPKFHIFTKIVICKFICNFLDQLLHPYKFHGRDMSGILFFIFASCEPLTPLSIPVDLYITTCRPIFTDYHILMIKVVMFLNLFFNVLPSILDLLNSAN